jgi:hypothetical protein
MTGALVDATTRLAAVIAGLEELEEFERTWSAGARKERLAELHQVQQEAAYVEAAERDELVRASAALAAELEPMYADALAAMEAFVIAAEKVVDVRTEYEDARRKVRGAGIGPGPHVLRAGVGQSRTGAGWRAPARPQTPLGERPGLVSVGRALQ